MGTASLARVQLQGVDEGRPAAESLETIESICTKAANLCGQMLAYAGRGQTVVELVDLSVLLRETKELLGASVSKDVSFDIVLPDAPPLVEVDRSQMQQVVMNLLINATEAMNGRGTVGVRITEVAGESVDWTGAKCVPEEIRGDFLEVVISDQGVGMDEATLSRLFEPFFTTKFAGRGLGLAATLGIMRQHGGGLVVTSEPDAGTVFRLYFRSSERTSQVQVKCETETEAVQACRVLLVDDEAGVRESTRRMLEALGHHVATARDGIEGMARYDAARSRFDLVLLDLTMPGMDGIATLEAFRERTPELPVILMSGYTEEDVRSRLKDERTTFLPKPFSFERLEEAIRAGLHGGERRPPGDPVVPLN